LRIELADNAAKLAKTNADLKATKEKHKAKLTELETARAAEGKETLARVQALSATLDGLAVEPINNLRAIERVVCGFSVLCVVFGVVERCYLI
jgi:hypothetical protein